MYIEQFNSLFKYPTYIKDMDLRPFIYLVYLIHKFHKYTNLSQ